MLLDACRSCFLTSTALRHAPGPQIRDRFYAFGSNPKDLTDNGVVAIQESHGEADRIHAEELPYYMTYIPRAETPRRENWSPQAGPERIKVKWDAVVSYCSCPWPVHADKVVNVRTLLRTFSISQHQLFVQQRLHVLIKDTIAEKVVCV